MKQLLMKMLDAVPRCVVNQIRWERDMAMAQLEAIGVGFCEVTDDVVKVVRCKECKNRGTESCYLYFYDAGYNEFGEDYVHVEDKTKDDFFCANGEQNEVKE